MAIIDQVAEFHRAFGLPVVEVPTVPSDEVIRLRARLIGEEFVELLDALGFDSYHVAKVKLAIHFLDRAPLQVPPSLPDVADACADLDYVVEGTRLSFGINGEPIAEAVHISNMRKVGATVRADGKVLKPEGWAPPDIEGCLRAQGWKP